MMVQCSKCGTEHDRPQRYCAPCHAANMREWRKTHPLNPAHRKRDIARHAAKVYVKRGEIEPKACEVCADPKAQMHHPDHELPKLVTWLCRPCHLEWHAHWRQTAQETFARWLERRRQEAKVSQADRPDVRREALPIVGEAPPLEPQQGPVLAGTDR